MWVLVALLCISVLIMLYLAIALRLQTSKTRLLNENLSQNMIENANFKAKCDEKDALIAQMKADFSAQKVELKNEYQANLAQLEAKYKANLDELKKELALNLAKQNEHFLLQNKAMLNDEGKKMLDEIFVPIKKSVKEYADKLATNEVALQTNIKNMFSFSQQIGAKADELAKILKGDKKIRGNFAELQLKNVLEHSGLKFGEQYKLQEHFNDDGKRYVPDAVVYLDKEKSIIIDAKFSLPSDFDFEENGENLRKELCENLKARIDELARKPYANFDAHTYDFVLLFIPYQNILDLALEFEPNLYQNAYKKKIYLTTPHTLFMALNTINISWRHIQSDENILKAFEELGKFYDKFAGVLETFEGIKRNANTLLGNVDKMQTQLSGRGGLIMRVEKLKELGIKTGKQIDKKAVAKENLLEFDDKNASQNADESENLFGFNPQKNGEKSDESSG